MDGRYMEAAVSTLQTAWESQQPQLEQLAFAMADAVEKKHAVFLFGCSHAGILSEELFYRTGGLALLNPIFFPGFMLNTRPVTMTSQLERLPGLGKILLDENRVGPGDLLIIHSVSGRNIVPVEMALEAKKCGTTVAALTNFAYSRSVSPRHASGKRLFEAADIAIDNCGPIGDAAVTLPGLPEKLGPTSTVVGAALLNAVVIAAVEELMRRGLVPPVFLSANIDGGDEHNRKIFEEYGDSITYM